MKGWVLILLVVAGVLAAFIVPVAIVICYAGWPHSNEQVDEENPPHLYQSREDIVPGREGLGLAYLLILSPLLLGL